MRTYRLSSLVLMLLFAVTGLLFLLFPDGVLGLFNSVSLRLGMAQTSLTGSKFFLILSVGYMYLVSFLAFLMLRHPENKYFPLLLMNAKFASSLLSLALYLLDGHYLIYLANFVIDGAIGTSVALLYVRAGRRAWAYS